MPLDRRATTEDEAIAWLVDQVPELRPLLDEHVAYNEEMLSYVVFESDFLRWFIIRVRAGDHDPSQRFVAAVEPLMTTDVEPPANDRVWNLAGVAFVEGLVMQGVVDDVIDTARPWMGPNTSRDFDRMFRCRGICRLLREESPRRCIESERRDDVPSFDDPATSLAGAPRCRLAWEAALASTARAFRRSGDGSCISVDVTTLRSEGPRTPLHPGGSSLRSCVRRARGSERRRRR